MPTHTLLFNILMFVLMFSDFNQQKNGIDYNLRKPDKTLVLPAILNEVSGLSDLDQNHIACTQDELGIIFIVNLTDGQITEKLEFEATGDFEGLTFANNAFYILRSDGQLTVMPDYNKPETYFNIKENLPTKNNEGLGYDRLGNRLLIAAKSKPHKESNIPKDDRVFYQYLIKEQKLDTNPVFTLKVDDFKSFAMANNISLPVPPSKKINFRPSSIAVHPKSSLLYILSAVDFLLLVCDDNGKIRAMETLNPKLFPQAEGITFLDDNTMIITNEAADKVPTLLMFKYEAK